MGMRIRIGPTERRFVESTTRLDIAVTETPVISPGRGQYSQQKFDQQHIFQNGPSDQNQQEIEAACNLMLVNSYQCRRPRTNSIM